MQNEGKQGKGNGTMESLDERKEIKSSGVIRNQSIDLLRGLTCISMVLVNSYPSPRPGWLSHPTGINEPITFADTLFPCFLFTSGLATTRPTTSVNRKSSKYIRKQVVRASKLIVLGIIYNNVMPRMVGSDPRGMLDFSTYRIPSVLGRIGMASVVSSLESYFDIPTPILSGFLGTIWYFAARSNVLVPIGSSTQSKLDCLVFGRNHLYDPANGFDPEGLLGSLLSAPISILMGRYVAAYFSSSPSLSTTDKQVLDQPARIISLGVLGCLLTGLFPSPSSKSYWTPTFIGQSTSLSMIYYSLSQALTKFQSSSVLVKVFENLGKRSLEIFFLSSFVSQLVRDGGTFKNILFKTIGEYDHRDFIFKKIIDRLNFSDVQVGFLRSSLICLGMIPSSYLMVRFGWKIPV
ncbi:hypothetical protein BY996DRAFT_6412318 [Phakopsora pachyrhizi]|uniref:Heparan-alpha-glucosaminide N-acetyltransferase catalytic domain-containing protein n=1 Tax=Phakopsora pachyrhizi TaxID=170000 RepID=A0A0S1MIT1_PHAPC|nr:hypothetical protein BY996DRAFT_6412318 [Phakopsora pachyrhizi]CAH7673092.1 hypothetical protein PPACK8108_LOCUS7952 [Phakopsora pachyrhizi]